MFTQKQLKNEIQRNLPHLNNQQHNRIAASMYVMQFYTGSNYTPVYFNANANVNANAGVQPPELHKPEEKSPYPSN